MKSHRLVLFHFMFYYVSYILYHRKKEDLLNYLVNYFFVVLVVKPLSALVCIEPRRI